jgi:general secretion pathway protein K
MWMLAALATLASVYAVYVAKAALSTGAGDDSLRARAATLSGLAMAAYAITSDGAAPPEGAFTLRLERASVDVSYVAEGARVDLNAASKEMLAGLFVALGVGPDEAANLAARVVGWRRAKSKVDDADEADLYRSAGLDYAPRRAPFRGVLELPLVLGFSASIVERALPYLTVFNGRGEIDVRVADPRVLAALPKADPTRLAELLAQRARGGADGEALLNLLGPARAEATATTSPAIRVNTRIRLDDGAVARAEAVILILKDEDRPYRVLAWSDEIDGTSADAPGSR